MTDVKGYDQSYFSMTWLGDNGYPQQANAGRCYFTGMLGQLRHMGEPDVLFADGISGDGFSFRWLPMWGAPAFNGGKGAFHEIWEYTPKILGYRGHWEEDDEDGWDGAWAKLRSLVDRGIPVQVGLHYSLMLPYGAKTSPRLAFLHETMGPSGFGHHVIVAGYNLAAGTVTIFEPNDVLPFARYEAPIEVFARAWKEADQRDENGYKPWVGHHPWGGEWTLHDGYGPYLMVWVEPERDPNWDIAHAIRDSFRRNTKILSGEYPRPYAVFGSQWQIPTFHLGAPGMLACVEAIRAGTLKDTVAPGGQVRPLFVQGNIPNHGVMGRAGAAGYLRRVAKEMALRNLRAEDVTAAADCMQASSDLFRALRYETALPAAGEILAQIAGREMTALRHMQAAWADVKLITRDQPLALAAE